MNNIGHEAQEMLELVSEKQKSINKKMNIRINGGESFGDLCSLITRDDMNDIADCWGIGKLSKLKKNEFAEAIKEELLNKFEEKILNVDVSILGAINVLLNNDGSVSGEKCLEINNEAVYYLKKSGIVFLGKNEDNKMVVTIPSDIKTQIQEIVNSEKVISKIGKNSMVLRVTRGILYYYGIVEIKSLGELINKIMKEQIEVEEIKAIVKENIEGKDDINLLSDLKGLEHYEFVASSKLSNPVEMIYAQNSNGLDYKGFSVDELMQAGEVNYNEWDSAHDKLYHYILDNFDVADIEAKMLVNAVIYGFKDGSTIEQSLEVLNACFMCNSTEKRDFEKLLIKAQEQTRLWSLKGHMTADFKAQTVVKEDKIGRNDPCPCGSGKKYKKCCGKN